MTDTKARAIAVVPCYNTSSRCAEVISEAMRYVDAVLAIDDGSSDDTLEHIRNTGCLWIRSERNEGKGHDLRKAFEAILGNGSGPVTKDYDYIVTLDGDLQNDPADIPMMLAKLDEGSDLVHGWRKDRQDAWLTRRLPSQLANWLISKTTRFPIHDLGCTLKAMRREIAQELELYGEMHRFIPILAHQRGARSVEVVTNHRARQFGRTKFGLERYIRGFLDLITVAFLTRFAARPMHFFGMLGTLAFVGGFAISLWITIDKLVFGNPVGDRPLLLLGALLIIVGVQTFCTGFLADLMIRRRMEETPPYQITEVVEASTRQET